jgi:hypothetical protein
VYRIIEIEDLSYSLRNIKEQLFVLEIFKRRSSGNNFAVFDLESSGYSCDF